MSGNIVFSYKSSSVVFGAIIKPIDQSCDPVRINAITANAPSNDFTAFKGSVSRSLKMARLFYPGAWDGGCSLGDG